MLINLRNALMSGRRLPYDAEVEYLQSSGTQYIDTLVNADSNLSVEITMANAGTPWTNVNPGGVILATPRYRHHLNFNNNTNYNGINYYLGAGDMCLAASGYRPADGEIFTFKVDATSKTFTLGSFLGTFPNDTFNTGLSYWLFGRNGTTPPYLGSLRICSAKLWNGSVLVRDFIPVRRGTTGYLYDRVSKRLFGNAGTGDFVLGPDVVPVEYIESHGTEYIDTGIILNDTYGIDINFAPMETASGVSEHGIFGSSVSGSGIRHNVLQIHSSAGGVGLWMPSNTRICNYAITVGEYQHWQINLNDSDEVVVDNVLRAHTHPTTPAECQYPVYLFGRNMANTLKSGSCSKMRLATWMVCDGSGNFIQKMLPVRVGSSSTWEGAMMDVLTRRIYRNAGTGAFTFGNDLKYPIPAS